MPSLEARGVELSWSGNPGGDSTALLIHESATDRSVWGPLTAALEAAGVAAVAYDRRGWGATGAAPDYRRTTVEEQSEDAAALIEGLGMEEPVVCGAGMGAVIALDLLLRLPELIGGAILIEPPLLGLVPDATNALAADRDEIEAAAGRGVDALVGLYLGGDLTALGAGAARLPAELTEPALESPVGLLAEIGAVPSWRMPLSRLGGARRPSVIVTAPGTPPLLRDAAAALLPRLAGAQPAVVGAEGPPHLEAPVAVAALVASVASG